MTATHPTVPATLEYLAVKNMLLSCACLAALLAGCTGQDEDKPNPIPVGQLTAAPTGDGWINLLDEQHKDGWQTIPTEYDMFEIVEGILHIKPDMPRPMRYAGYMAERFGDFDLHAEFKVAPGANSGIFVRMQPGEQDRRGFEIQVQDDFGKPIDKNTCGAIYDVVTPMYNMCFPAGEWNSLDVSVHGGEVEITMNGWLIVKANLDQMTMPLGKYKVPFAELPKEGVLAIQNHYTEAWYRNVMIRPVRTTPPTEG